MAPLGRMLLVGNASGDWQHTVATDSLPLAEAAEAHRRAENGSVGGRILLAP